MDPFDHPFMVLGAALITTALIAFGVIYSAKSSYEQRQAEAAAFWGGSQLVRICPGGIRIYRLRGGQYVTQGRESVAHPAVVCPAS